MELKSVKIQKPEEANIILGQTHFIKSVEDLYEAMINAVPGFKFKFGLAFCEASQDCLVRSDGNDEELKKLAEKNAFSIGAGHTFIIIMQEAFPLNFLGAIKQVPEVCTIFCATANEVDVVVAENERGKGIIGVIDGEKPKGIETEGDISERKEFLRKIGYKR
jgi:adenosine/AMP kinase